MKGQGEGKYRDEVLTGQSERAMRFIYKITGTAKRAVVRMSPPRYFTRPFVGSFTDPRTGKQKIVGRQPDKPDEVTRISEEDRQELRGVAQSLLMDKIEKSRPAPTTINIP
jgi:hypothetical protein